jgi:plastocyanin domain-containing protein
MKYAPIILSNLIGLSLGITSGSLALAQMSHNMATEPPVSTEQQFQRIEQPLWTKLVVAGVGMGLIGLELWWFVLSQPTAQQSKATGGVGSAHQP